ncbi:hypothetical protein Mterra_02655 [Calidithermus terrae]|uniref:DUF3185 domain-containing protein n=1 Tax=Calidithermus terrae TaxID=1408545 RepID=A0A399EJW4_9DEIN|nr:MULTISPECIES: hypothetical protein [Calidithermus]RIH82451.1 hypothetical protein Mterra_02655 [Calidithermus terrae]
MRIFGVVLIVVGLAVLAVPRITFTEREKIVDFGPLEVQTERTRSIPLPDVLGGVAVAAGVLLALFGDRGRRAA